MDNEVKRWGLISEPQFDKMKVASWHIRTLPHHISSTFGLDCPYSH